MKSYQSDFHETWNEALAEEKWVDCWCRSRLCCKNIKTLMQFWQQIGKGLAFRVVFLVLSRHKKMMEQAKVITKVYALISDGFS